LYNTEIFQRYIVQAYTEIALYSQYMIVIRVSPRSKTDTVQNYMTSCYCTGKLMDCVKTGRSPFS